MPYASPQQKSYANITEVNAPASIGIRQALTVNVTVSYSYSWADEEGLLVAILNLTNHPLPTRTRSSTCYFPSAESMCFARAPTNNSLCCQGVFTASFMLTSPNQSEAWYLDVDAGITRLNVSSTLLGNEGYSIVATSHQPLAIYVTPSPIPEASSAVLLVLGLIVSACLTKRHRAAYLSRAPVAG